MSPSSAGLIFVGSLLGGPQAPTEVTPSTASAIGGPREGPSEARIDPPIEAAEENASATSTTMIVWVDAAAPTAAWAERVQRVQAELAALGVRTVLFVPPAGEGSTSDVMREMTANDSAVAVWIAADRDRAELWRLDGRRLQNIAIVAGEGAQDDGTFAVRCAEIAHAFATEVAPIADEPSAPAVAIAPPPPPPPAPRGDLRVGFAIGGASRDVGTVLGPSIGGGVRLGRERRLGLDAELGVTALRGRVSGPAGSARIGWLLARAHVGVWPLPRARVSPMIGIGGGVLMAWTQGRGEGAYEGRRDSTVTGLASVLLDVAIRLSRRTRLRPGARVAVALPPLAVDTRGDRNRTALPLGEVVLALDILWGMR